MPDLNPEDLIFLDFEASGLSRSSWPIEIGLAWIRSGEVQVWSSLIRPAPGWDMEAWSPSAEGIHGISRGDLDAAPPPHVVAAQAARLMAGRMVCSDAPEHEERWAARLFSERSGDLSFPINYMHNAFVRTCTEAQLDWLYEKLARLPAPHRAGPDAARYAKALLYSLEARPEGPGLGGVGAM